jgi:lipoyl-dependent peroxiredoxin
MVRKARAVWRGTGKDGSGHLTSDSGVLSSTPYSFKTRFENEKGTNPEELIAAAHAGCFTMALAFQLQGAGYDPTELSTEAAVSLEKEGQGNQQIRPDAESAGARNAASSKSSRVPPRGIARCQSS